MKVRQHQIDSAFEAAGNDNKLLDVLEALFGKRNAPETLSFDGNTFVRRELTDKENAECSTKCSYCDVQQECPYSFDFDNNKLGFCKRDNVVYVKEQKKFEHYTDIKTYEDACEYLNIEPRTLDNTVMTADEIAYAKLKVIARAIRGGEEFSYQKAIANGQYYYPWWYICTKEYYDNELSEEDKKRGVCFGGIASYGANAGFAYADATYAPSITRATIGSRLCFYDRERCNYFCEQFKELIVQYNFIGCE